LITLCKCFLGIEPHWALWRRIFVIRRPLHYQTGGFSYKVRPDVEYFNLRMLENNPGWRTRWFYTKDQPAVGQEFGLDEFRPTNVLRPRASWAHELTKEEMAITQPFMEKIRRLRATPEKEVSGLQLIHTFIKRQIQPLAARAHRMWDYTSRRDSTRFSSDELREAKIDDGVRAVTCLKKKSAMPKNFGTEAFSKSHPRTEVCTFCSLIKFL
jgi:hypothetical protein